MGRKILLVEDNNHKRGRIVTFINEFLGDVEITEAHSFTSGCQKLTKNDFDLILLDMSLPTYDKSDSENGGKFRPFGGKEIARKVKRRKIKTKIIFITQYDSFSEKGHSHSLESLTEELKTDIADNIESVIYYDTSKSSWKDELKTSLNKVFSPE